MTCQKHMSRIDADDAPAPPSCSHSATTHRLPMSSTAFIARHASIASHHTLLPAHPFRHAHRHRYLLHMCPRDRTGGASNHPTEPPGIWMTCAVLIRWSAPVSIVLLMHFDGRHGTRAVPCTFIPPRRPCRVHRSRRAARGIRMIMLAVPCTFLPPRRPCRVHRSRRAAR